MNQNLMCAVLDCQSEDLAELDNATCDFRDIVENLATNGKRITLQAVIEEMFTTAIENLERAVHIRHKELCKKLDEGTITEGDLDQYLMITETELNPKKDFSTYVNYQDTHLYGDSDKRNAYEDLFEEELLNIEEYTGYEIEW